MCRSSCTAGPDMRSSPASTSRTRIRTPTTVEFESSRAGHRTEKRSTRRSPSNRPGSSSSRVGVAEVLLRVALMPEVFVPGLIYRQTILRGRRQAAGSRRGSVGRFRVRRRARGRSRPLGRRAPMANPDEPAPVPRTSRPKKAAPRARSVSSSATASTASTTEPAKPKGKAAKPKTVAAKPKAEAAKMAPRRAASARRTRPGST